MKYVFMNGHQGTFRVSEMSRILQVSRSGFYAWRKRRDKPSPRQQHRKQLDTAVKKAFDAGKNRSGSPRLVLDLAAAGHQHDRKTIAESMRRRGLRARAAKKFKATTNSSHRLPVAPNLLQQDCTATTANRKYVGDITYLWTEEGWLYLAVVIDLYSRRVVGWAMSKRMTAQPVCDALPKALWRRHAHGGHCAFRPRQSVLLRCLPAVDQDTPVAMQYECKRELLRQCVCRGLLPFTQGGSHSWRAIRHPGGDATNRFRIHRSGLQSNTPTQRQWLYQPGSV